MTDIFAFGLGVARYSVSGSMLDCFFPQPLLKPAGELAQSIAELPTGASEINSDKAQALDQAYGSGLISKKLIKVCVMYGCTEASARLTYIFDEIEEMKLTKLSAALMLTPLCL